MPTGQLVTCDHCRKGIPLSEIKYVLKGKDQTVPLCAACRSKYKTPVEKKSVEPKSDKVPYFCIRCKYKFRYNPKSGTALRCPFCGREDKVIEDKVPDADTLIRTLHDE
ncbi:MAG: hypothetical protein V1837_03695 [Candidatus Woesearchaeota archaeon]